MSRYQLSREKNIQTLRDRGLEILSEWTGQRVSDRKNTAVPVTVRNLTCGHTFTSTAVNLLSRGVTCSVCARMLKTSNINHWSERNSDRWRQTATEWKKYRASVTKHTRVAYRDNVQILNPLGLPFGRAGTKGAHHLDHIVPVRWCFERAVPPALVSDVSNLQVLPWLHNVVARDHIKGDLPLAFHPYL